MKSEFQKFSPVLRKLKFRLDYRFRSRTAGDINIYKLSIPEDDRVVEVQIWGDGQHRASHMIHGCMDTYPSEFNTVAGMLEAVKIESTRTDNVYGTSRREEERRKMVLQHVKC